MGEGKKGTNDTYVIKEVSSLMQKNFPLGEENRERAFSFFLFQKNNLDTKIQVINQAIISKHFVVGLAFCSFLWPNCCCCFFLIIRESCIFPGSTQSELEMQQQ